VIKFPSKKWAETDIEVSITHCGVCGSDVHTITNGWGDMSEMLPIVPGHEIIGTAVRVGKDVKTVKVGDRVGVGAQVASCYECKLCKNDNENYCAEKVDTYVRPLFSFSSSSLPLLFFSVIVLTSLSHRRPLNTLTAFKPKEDTPLASSLTSNMSSPSRMPSSPRTPPAWCVPASRCTAR
jgi:hypothetical protein